MPPLLALVLLALARPAAALPDLVPDATALGQSVRIEVKTFGPLACELAPEDRCIDGPGTRKLLRFDVVAQNRGADDLRVGVPGPDVLLPSGEPMWIWSPCHQHWHFQSFARYALRPLDGRGPEALGRKRSFCIEDTEIFDAAAPEARRYCCPPEACLEAGTQGLQAGWGDRYAASVPCQWIDVSDLAPGTYELSVVLNSDGILPDADRGNDAAAVTVTIAGPSRETPAPRLKLRRPQGGRPRRAGRALAIAWRTRMQGGEQALAFHDVLLSLDGGATWELLAGGLGPRTRRLHWPVAPGTSSDAAVVRVVAWSVAGQKAVADGRPFRIAP